MVTTLASVVNQTLLTSHSMKANTISRPTIGIALCLLISALCMPLQAQADESALIQELKALTSKSKQQNAADRWLQRALESLVAKYDNPWTRQLLEEDFSDGDYTQAPSWQAVSGRFRVDATLGLISRVQHPAGQTPTSQTARSNITPPASTPKNDDLTSALLGALLQGALGEKPSGTHPSKPTPASTPRSAVTPAKIRLPLAISNAFDLESDFSLHAGPSEAYELEYSLFQDRREQWGYRLHLVIDQRANIELQRVRRGRTEVVSSAALPSGLVNGAPHTLTWRQAPAGLVQVMLDGNPLFEVQDKAFRDGYKAISFINLSGDIALRRLAIKGTE